MATGANASISPFLGVHRVNVLGVVDDVACAAGDFRAMAHDGPARVLQMAGYAADFAKIWHRVFLKIEDPSFFGGKSMKCRDFSARFAFVAGEQFRWCGGVRFKRQPGERSEPKDRHPSPAALRAPAR